jgi:hypothetical protein
MVVVGETAMIKTGRSSMVENNKGHTQKDHNSENCQQCQDKEESDDMSLRM